MGIGRVAVSFFCIAGLLGAAHADNLTVAGDAALVPFAVYIDRTPPQPWPGYGVYLGNGYVLTAAHVAGSPSKTKPNVIIAGKVLPAKSVREGSFDNDDLTILRVDLNRLPESQRRRHVILCANLPPLGAPVVVITPKGYAVSYLIKPSFLPAAVLSKFPTLIGDVASTGNSGSGVFDRTSRCLLGIMSRKITLQGSTLQDGHRQPKTVDIAKYFVPFTDIRAAIPPSIKY